MAEIILAETASTNTPAAATVSFYADNTANPQLKFKDDGGNVRTVVDDNNTVTISNKTFVAPVLGAATGTSVAVTGALSSSGSAGIGYATGAGGTVTQSTSKATAFTLSKICGTIVTAADALAGNTNVTSTWTNTAIAANDVVVIQHQSGGTLGAYNVTVTPGAGTATLVIRNITGGSLSEALTLRFCVIKAVVS